MKRIILANRTRARAAETGVLLAIPFGLVIGLIVGAVGGWFFGRYVGDLISANSAVPQNTTMNDVAMPNSQLAISNVSPTGKKSISPTRILSRTFFKIMFFIAQLHRG